MPGTVELRADCCFWCGWGSVIRIAGVLLVDG